MRPPFTFQRTELAFDARAAMRHAVRSLAIVLACWFSLFGLAFAEPVRTANVETEFHSSRAVIAPGETFTIALRQRIRDGWHTYWRNPGDSGENTQITWRNPPGVVAGEIQWPAPERIPFDILVNYGYSGEVLFPIEVTAPRTLRPGQTLTLAADVTWLVCSDICIPEDGVLSLPISVSASGADNSEWASRISGALAALPKPANFDARITPNGEGARLTFAGDAIAGGAARIRTPHFFPYRADAIEHAAPEDAGIGERGVSVSLKPGAANDLGQTDLEGVLTVEERSGDAWVKRSYEVRAAPGEMLPGAGAAPIAARALTNGVTLPVALLFAFIGGLLLNIMPCVFPVLSLKALSLAQHADERAARRGGILFSAGVLVTFLGLAGVLVALKASGQALGWGFQLQTPLVVAALAALFFVIGLNLLGAFEIGGALQNLGGGLAARSGDAGAFFTGALAVVAATPCTAPFMASATGFSATQGALTTLLVFATLALGFAAPFAALSFIPAFRKILPRPGAWMNQAKIVLAFPMFGAAVWLAWVLAAQTGPNGLLALLSVLTALGFLVAVSRWSVIWRGIGVAALLIVAAFSWEPLTETAQAETSVLAQETWSPERVQALQSEGKGVFVNFTAAWCVTCQVNKVTTLSSQRVIEAFAARNVAYLEADWTNRNDVIAAALAEHGRDGVPLYLYYPPGSAEARVLPQVLSEDSVINAIIEGQAE
ncbi:MAG: protein-disulfide reductase DsbD domain-containing protein [Caulobacterales bacterium]